MVGRKQVWCPVRVVLEAIEGKWTIHIISELMTGRKRHKELAKSLSGINPKTLTDRLRDLESMRIVRREMFQEIPPRVEYSLTRKGLQISEVLDSLKRLGILWNSQTERKTKIPECKHCFVDTDHRALYDGDGDRKVQSRKPKTPAAPLPKKRR